MKYCFVAVQVDYTGKPDCNGGRRAMFAYTEVYRPGENLAYHLRTIPGLVSATFCETRKQADDLVTAWNAGFRDSGIYAL